MKIGLYPNCNRDKEAEVCRATAQILRNKGVDVCVGSQASRYFAPKYVCTPERMAQECDVVVTFGGDGTMLEAVGHFAPYKIPLLGVNAGHIGFLTETDKRELDRAADRLICGDYRTEERSMICARCENKIFYALNEVLLGSNDNCHIVTVEVEIDGVFADRIRGDGVLVSTPTGSTAYSLSCGGPILSPDVKALIINTVCPHSLHSCPIVISDGSKVRLTTFDEGMKLVYDGKIAQKFDHGDICVEIEKCEYGAFFIRLEEVNFYHRLVQKLSYWGD